ncbi:hypothetical protein MKQ70_14790 [Chitinophaga sedimenti]|uniref:hypothetical protein n=1 Tax=Chitinophaga sedimenti TaxID=2033606 RepID=UPI002003148B|nr:hypothetical protein [Chitinophaga sedimenti]MCK7556212.1 hypothetical protein [Chitinophaga sedimenti]
MHDYLLWQSQYFSSGQATDQEKLVAGFTYLAFNEPLQLLLERGIVGVLLVGGIIWLFFRRTPSSSTPLLVRCIQVSGLSVLVTSLFSYPLHSLPILFFLAVLIGIRETLSGTAVFRIPVKRYRRIMLAVAMLITGAMCWSMTSIVRKAAAAYEWTEALQKADISIATYEKLQNEIGFNAIFLFDYGNILLHNGRYDEAAQSSARLPLLLPT